MNSDEIDELIVKAIGMSVGPSKGRSIIKIEFADYRDAGKLFAIFSKIQMHQHEEPEL